MQQKPKILAQSHKRADVEALRVLGAFAIVWFHSSTIFRDTAYAGLVFFLILSTSFASSPSNTFGERFSKRIQRLLTPWAIWFLVYAAMNLLRGTAALDTSRGLWSGILSGPSFHLWYLPFIFLVLVLSDAIHAHVKPREFGICCALLTAGLLLLLPIILNAAKDAPPPLSQYLNAGPAVFAGMFFRHFQAVQKRLAYVLLTGMLLTAAIQTPTPGVGIPYFIGLLAGSVIVHPLRTPAWAQGLASLGKYAYGVYLSHAAMLLLVWKLGVANLHAMLVPVIAFSLSVVFVALLQYKFPKLSKNVC